MSCLFFLLNTQNFHKVKFKKQECERTEKSTVRGRKAFKSTIWQKWVSHDSKNFTPSNNNLIRTKDIKDLSKQEKGIWGSEINSKSL